MLAATAQVANDPLMTILDRETALTEALAAARAIGDDYARALALTALAPHLPETLLVDALAAARAISDDHVRAHALTTLAPHLPETLLVDALAAARAIGNDYARALALTALAPHLPETEREAVLRETLAAARAIGDDYARANALLDLALHLPQISNFAQTFATRILPKNPQLPELVFISVPVSPGINLRQAVAALEAELEASEEHSYLAGLELRGFAVGGIELLETTLSWQLRAGTVGRLSMFDLSNYRNVALDIIETAEIPIKASALKGSTLATLATLAGASGTGILELFNSSANIEHACISVIFFAGTIVLFGAARGLSRALEAGLEQTVLKLFGVTEQRQVGARRAAATKLGNAGQQADIQPTVKETQSQLAAREAHSMPAESHRTEDVRSSALATSGMS